MDNPKIDLLKQKYDLDPPTRHPFPYFGKVFLALAIFFAIGGSVFSYQVASSSEPTGQFPRFGVFSTIKQIVQSSDKQLKGEEEDRINFLLMGVGGAGHDGPQLSDTMILASYRPSDGSVGMISVPRDLTVPIPGYGWRKINHANAYGEIAATGSGPNLAVEVVENTFKQPIHYYLRVDFAGFEELIDILGGVDVNVEKSFVDPEYPTHGKEYATCGSTYITNEEGETITVPDYSCRYEVLRFTEGPAHMDGELALKYVRSRHGTNGEGSDFARSRRQRQVLLAVKDKVLTASTLLNPGKINSIQDTLEKNIATNLETWEILRLAQVFKDLDSSQISHHVLDDGPGSPLYATNLNGAYVLLPRNDNWWPLQQMANNIFSKDPLSNDAEEKNGSSPLTELARTEIQNGTNMTGLALRTSQVLDGQGFNVLKIGNAKERGYEHTVIYDFTSGARPHELTVLQEYLGAEIVVSPEGWVSKGEISEGELPQNTSEYAGLTTVSGIDFFVILGEDYARTVRN